MNIIFFDESERQNLLPFTFNKPVSELRIGILTFRERWERFLKGDFSYLTSDYLQIEYPLIEKKSNLFLNPSFFPVQIEFVEQIKDLKNGESIWDGNGNLIAAISNKTDFQNRNFEKKFDIKENWMHLQNLWDLFVQNDTAIKFDFELITKDRLSQPISLTNSVINADQIFIEEGAVVEYSILNAENGPIYIGENAQIMEGSMIRGSFALCENGIIKMGSKIYGGTTVGPWCKVGGEVSNSILMAYSNKAHDGYLGNSVLGEWCNLGAGTNSSNLKSNYSEVKIWSYKNNREINTGLQFCGLFMGDYSKSSINTQFNTGTVVGFSSNIIQMGFPSKFISSFSWGGGEHSERFKLEKVYEAAEKMKKRRKKTLKIEEKKIIKFLYESTEY